MDFVAQQLLTGLSIGSILLLAALGLAIIYGAMGVINLAHGEFLMLGAYAAWALQSYAGIGLLPALPLIFLAVALLGWVVERAVIRHLYRRPLDTILATWGIGVMLQQAVRLLAGGELRYVRLPPVLDGAVPVLGQETPVCRIFVLFGVAALFALTWFLIYRTAFGMRLRAVVQDPSVASCFGINAGRVYATTFAYGAGLAGLAGALVAPLKSVSPEMGTGYVVDAFMVVVIGGVQSLFGAVVSAALLGEASGVLAFRANDTVAQAVVLLAVVFLIRFRPQGLFAARVRA
ncbi:MAG TPA: urea ABC transporter permease subunit UrtB [Crenalkalicoccus sp.]|nr:urea ABC transporter permease subunit UrtB [Crenalkalicoccus sp.]